MAAKRDAEPIAQPNTPEWREKVRKKLATMPRGTLAAMAKKLRVSTGHLSETIKDDPNNPDGARWTRLRQDIEEYLWPPLRPLSKDTAELEHILEGLRDADHDLLRAIRDMDRDEQRRWAQVMIGNRKRR